MTTVRELLTEHYGEDFAREDYRNGMSHVFTVEDSGYPDYREIVVLNHTKARDVFGYDSPVETSNYRVLEEAWGDLEGFSRGRYSNCDVIAFELDAEAPEDMIDIIEGLSDYPVIDESAWSEVEQEFIQEHWESYGEWELHRAVEKALGADELTDYAKDVLKSLVWEGILEYGCGGGWPTMIDDSACDFGDEEIVRWIKARLGRRVTVSTNSGYGNRVTFDLRPHRLIEA